MRERYHTRMHSYDVQARLELRRDLPWFVESYAYDLNRNLMQFTKWGMEWGQVA